MATRTLTAWQEIELWWALHGELGSDLITYYGLCSAWGALQGWLIGNEITALLGGR